MDFLKRFGSKKNAGNKSNVANKSNDTAAVDASVQAKPKGILKNRNDAQKYVSTDSYPASDNIDESLRNAQKNSSLNQSVGNTRSTSPATENAEEQKKETHPDAKPTKQPVQNVCSDSVSVSQKKGLKWDEDNLDKNEREKVPRMKIDEPPTPYAERPSELQFGDEDMEEIILDADDLETGGMDEEQASELSEHASTEKTLDQQQQSLLLQDDAYRQQMIKDALSRRQDQVDSNAKVIQSAWEDDGNAQSATTQHSDDEDDASAEAEQRKQAFKKKRNAHYNEFHAIKARQAKQQQMDQSDQE